MRNVKSLVGFIIFFTSTCSIGYTVYTYLQTTKFNGNINMVTVFSVVSYIILFIIFIGIYRYEVDSKINLYENPNGERSKEKPAEVSAK